MALIVEEIVLDSTHLFLARHAGDGGMLPRPAKLSDLYI